MSTTKKIFILALDGTPYSLLRNFMDQGFMPNLKQIVQIENLKRMNSVIPPISSVAWATFMTGKNPAQHNIFGFIDRVPETMEVYVPTTINLKSKTIFEYLSEKGKKVFTMNVPVTFPPREINGIMICGFLGTDILKGTYPDYIGRELKDNGYIIDVDTWKAREDIHWFIRELNLVLKKRIETMWHYYRQENWDFFLTHIMETDRLHHFVWEYMANGDAYWTEEFIQIYRTIDKEVGKILNELNQNAEFMMLSDHGFTGLKKEVFVNKWLFDHKFLSYNTQDPPESLHDINKKSQAYSLIPGRIYINLKGREKNGSVNPGIEYEKVREEVKNSLDSIVNPDNGEKVVKAVKTREELYGESADILNIDIHNSYQKDDPFYLAPDLVALNEEGYDFKGNLWKENLLEKGPIVGTHTYDNAFLYIKDKKIEDREISIIDVYPTILEIMDIEFDKKCEGHSVLEKNRI